MNAMILDATNTTIKRRDNWKSDNWLRGFVVFSTPLAELNKLIHETGGVYS